MNGITTNLRFTGLASGLDTDSIVKDLMNAERVKFDRLYQQKTFAEWKNDAYRDVNNMLRTFKDDFLSFTNPEANMLTASSYLSNKVSMVSSGTCVRITSTKDAICDTYTIEKITGLATAAKASGTTGVSIDNKGLSITTTLNNLPLRTPLIFVDGCISFNFNGENFIFHETDTLQTVLNKINSNTKANATISYSSLTDSFTIKSKDTGSKSSLLVSNVKGNAFGIDSAFGILEGTYENGIDATLRINGIDVIKSTNSFDIDGINYTLNNTTDTPVTFTVEQDTDAIFNRIKNFVNGYNELTDKLNNLIRESSYRDYPPLTDAQKESMTEKDIEKWESFARSGLLKNDSNISMMLTEIRSAFSIIVEGTGQNAYFIGLTTGEYNTRGKIIIDENKLKQSIQNDPENVLNLFFNKSYSTVYATKFKESGISNRILDSINNCININQSVNSKFLDDRIREYRTKISESLDYLKKTEDRYWKQFTALEKAINMMNSQSNWLSQQFNTSGF